MAEILNLEEFLRNNPAFDGNRLQQSRDLLRKLREAGVHRPDYELSSPYQRRITATKQTVDPRAVKLRAQLSRTTSSSISHT